MKKEFNLKTRLLGAIGKVWMYYPIRLEAKKRATHPTKKGWYVCEICKEDREKLDIDHKQPCIKPSDGFTGWDNYLRRRFVQSASELQAICRDCHKEKTKEENKARRLCRKLKKSA